MNDKTMSAGEIVAALRDCPTAECAHCDFYSYAWCAYRRPPEQ